MKRKKWFVEEGRVVIGAGVQLISKGRNFRAYEVDFSTKYAEVLAYSEDTVLVDVGEYTKHYDEGSNIPTSIEFVLPKTYFGRWKNIATLSRYTLYVVFYRESLWRRFSYRFRMRY